MGDTLDTAPAKIASQITVQELGTSMLGSITAFRDVLLALTRTKNKYKLRAEAMAALIDLCEMQLVTLVMGGGQDRGTSRKWDGVGADMVADQLQVMERHILSAIGLGGGGGGRPTSQSSIQSIHH